MNEKGDKLYIMLFLGVDIYNDNEEGMERRMQCGVCLFFVIFF
jgi:hypothetical protein